MREVSIVAKSSIENILISVIIPIKNAEPWLREQLEVFAKQTLIDKSELIYIDSGSTDETMNILKDFGVNFIEIRPEEFNHGATRDLGVKHSKGKFILMTVQDAIPSSLNWLQLLLDGFIDETVVAVCGRQITPHHENKNPLQWFKGWELGTPDLRIEKYSNDIFENLSSEKKRSACNIDNVTTMYRGDFLRKNSFGNVEFGEDVIFGANAIKKGFTLVYLNSAKIFHYHHEFYDYALRRQIAAYYALYLAVGYMPIIPKKLGVFNILRIIPIIKRVVKCKDIKMSKKTYWIWYNFNRKEAQRKAAALFVEASKTGNNGVLKLYRDYCSVVPMAPRPNTK